MFLIDLMDTLSEYEDADDASTPVGTPGETDNGYIMYEIATSDDYKEFYVLTDHRYCCVSVVNTSGGSDTEEAARSLVNSVVWKSE